MNKENFLGGWAIEEIIDKAQFTAPKRYKLEVKEGDKIRTTIKAGGINFDFYKEIIKYEENFNILGKVK